MKPFDLTADEIRVIEARRAERAMGSPPSIVEFVRKPTVEQLRHIFRHHTPANEDIAEKLTSVRVQMLSAAVRITDLCPESSELCIAIQKLEEAMFWANAAIARKQT